MQFNPPGSFNYQPIRISLCVGGCVGLKITYQKAVDTTSSSSISSGDMTKSEGDAEVYGARSGARMSAL